ncbi:putative aminopeptidase [Dioscorea sansibarensis]
MVIRLATSSFKRLRLIGKYSSPITTPFRRMGEAIAAAAKSIQTINIAVVLASSDGLSVESNLITASAIATEFEQKLKCVSDIGSGVNFERQLGNAPANMLTPVMFQLRRHKMGPMQRTEDGFIFRCCCCIIQSPLFHPFVLYASRWSGKTKLAIIGCRAFYVPFIAAACENMISGTSMRPGDIITASNSKTIEAVNNTDAEGRLTLAYASVCACELGVDKVTAQIEFTIVNAWH